MVKPKSFGFNSETAHSNSFQNSLGDADNGSKAREEFKKMVIELESNQIDLMVFEDLIEGLPDSVFPNNWISNIPDQAVVVYPMLTPNRKREVRDDIINWTKEKLNLSDLIDLRNEETILEGTGSIVFDHSNKIAFAAISPRTSIQLLNKLCSMIGYESYSFESVDLSGGQIYHTNVMMSIAEKYAVVCFESIIDPIERSMLKKKLESLNKVLIEISYPQMNAFAGNVLEVNNKSSESVLLMSRTAREAFSENQINVIESYSKILDFDISTIEKIGGGSVRCMLAGFFNYPK